jgi:sporulation-control protein spo0M
MKEREYSSMINTEGLTTIKLTLLKKQIRQGGFLEGKVLIRGGKFAHPVNSIKLKLTTEIASGEREEYEDEKAEPTVIFEHTVNQPFHLNVEENRTLPFRVQLPFSLPISSDTSNVRIQFSIDRFFGLMQGDNEELVVEPLPFIKELFQVMKDEGYELKKTETTLCPSYLKSDTGFVQKLSYIPVRITKRPFKVDILMVSVSRRQVDCILKLSMNESYEESVEEQFSPKPSVLNLSVSPMNSYRLREEIRKYLSEIK